MSQAAEPEQRPKQYRRAFLVQRTMLGLLIGAPIVALFLYTLTHPFGLVPLIPAFAYGVLCIAAAADLLSLRCPNCGLLYFKNQGTGRWNTRTARCRNC